MSEASRRADARDVAVVVVNYRTPDLTIACLESVLETSEREPELIVVDNASDDGSADRIRQAVSRARVLEQESNGGFAAGVNAGVAATTAELVLLLNPDTTVEPGAIVTVLLAAAVVCSLPGCTSELNASSGV